MMALLPSVLLLSLVLFGFIGAEPDFCKRGARLSASYLHCFRQAHYLFPYEPLHEPRDVVDGCFVEAYANHTCRVVKPAALECFRRNISRCNQRERLFAIADESGGACFGSHINRIFKEHVLNFLEPVRGDSECFPLGDRAYECYGHAGIEMAKKYPNLDLLSVDGYLPVANEFFDSIYNCFIKIYRSNRALCENWQIPMLLELQGTALPSLFGMTFTADQMDKLELHGGCPVKHLLGVKPYWRNCYEDSDKDSFSSNGHPVSSSDKDSFSSDGHPVSSSDKDSFSSNGHPVSSSDKDSFSSNGHPVSSSDKDSSPEAQQLDQGIQDEEQEEQQQQKKKKKKNWNKKKMNRNKKKKKNRNKKKKNWNKKKKNRNKKKKTKPRKNKKQKAQTMQKKASTLLQTKQKKASSILQKKASPPLLQTRQKRQPSFRLLKRLQEEFESRKSP